MKIENRVFKGFGIGSVVMLIALVTANSGWAQTFPAPKYGDESSGQQMVTDWSARHLVYSPLGPEPPAGNVAAHNRWLRVASDPRYLMQSRHRSSPIASSSQAVNDFFNSRGDGRGGEGGNNGGNNGGKNNSTLHRDWAVSLGNGHMSAGASPAKYSFGETGVTTANCTTDFIVYTLAVTPSSTQANIVGINNLYAGSGGLCGATPGVTWAYNAATLSFSTLSTSPVLSNDGTMVAFVESGFTGTSGAAVLHVLKWKSSNGTVTTPVTPTAATNIATCTAPCMTSVTLSTSGSFSTVAESTLSAPFYAYGGTDDVIYVGNDNGSLFAVTGIFTGTPTVMTTNGWSAAGVTLASGSQLGPPVLDFGSGNIFVGAANGNLYAVNSAAAGTHPSIPVGSGSGSGNGGGVVDGPIVDGTSGTVVAYAAANAANVGATTASITAVVVQADTTTPLGNVQVATIGYGSHASGSLTSIDVHAGSFDNGYMSWSGSGANQGNFYEIGTAVGTTTASAYPVLYQIPYSGITSATLTANGSHYTDPGATITDATGSGASINPTGGVDGVNITTAGASFTGAGTVAFDAAPTGGTTATGAASYGLTGGTITANGSGYTAAPVVTVNGTHTTAGTATALMGISSISVPNGDGGSGYTAIPSVTATGGSPSASLAASLGASTVTMNVQGTGYSTYPTVTIQGGGTGTAKLGVNAIAVGTAGTKYTAVPAVSFSATGQNSAPTAVGVLGLDAVTVSANGTGYTSVPTPTFTGYAVGGAPVVTAFLGAVSYNIATNTGSTSLTNQGNSPTIPTVTVPAPGGTGNPTSTATATATYTMTSLAIGSSNGNGCTTTSTTTVNITGGISGTDDTVTYSSTTTTVTISSFKSNARLYSSASPPIIPNLGGCSTAANFNVTLKLNSVNSVLLGSGYTGATTAVSFSVTPSATVTVDAVFGVESVSVSPTTPGSGYTTGPVTASWSGGGGTGAAASADLKVVSINVSVPGSYSTTFPAATGIAASGGGGTNATLGALTAQVVGITVNTPGSSSSGLPTVTVSAPTSGTTATATVATGLVVGVALTTPNQGGSGYTSVPTVSIAAPTSGTTAIATAFMGVTSITASGGSYSTFPTYAIAAPGGTGNPTSTATGTAVCNIAGVTASTAGSGYSVAPGVTVTQSGATSASGTTTINVSAIALIYGGGGYTAPTITITDTGSGSGATVGAVTVNAGSVITPGTPPAIVSLDGTTTNVGVTPITEIYNPNIGGGTDYLFFGFGTSTAGDVLSENVTNPDSITAGATAYGTPHAVYGSTGIVVDNISASGQASSIYFGTLSTTGTPCTSGYCAVKLTQSGLN